MTSPSGHGQDDDTLRDRAAVVASGGRLVRMPARYEVVAPLGRGGMGEVVRAVDTVLGREVAVKLLDPAVAADAAFRARLAAEARAAALLRHPNIVGVHDVDPEGGYLVMELVPGVSLKELGARAPLEAAVVRRVAEDMASALAAAHAVGIVHRDVKPSNIILRPDGASVLVDFGVARLPDSEMTRTGHTPGTPAYMAPEQLRGEIASPRSDLYGLGATLYRLAAGAPFPGPGDAKPPALALLRRRCADAALVHVIETCLQDLPENRFAGAVEMRAALRAPAPAAASGPAEASAPAEAPARAPAPAVQPPPRARRRRRALLVAVPAVALALVAGGSAALLLDRLPGADARLEDAWNLAQRGEHERARELLAAYLVDHPDDPSARTLEVLVVWWTAGDAKPAIERALAAPLDDAQRALVRAISLMHVGREIEAIAFLEEAERASPGRPEVLYALGEALWHGLRPGDAAAALRRALEADPRWRMALHHLVDYHLGRGEPAALRSIVTLLRPVDDEVATAVEAQMLTAERRYDDAARAAEGALARHPDSVVLRLRLSAARTLAGALDAGEAAAREAFGRSPVDERDEGAFAHWVEHRLYRGDVDGYLTAVGAKARWIRYLTVALWRPETAAALAPDFPRPSPVGMGTRLAASTIMLVYSEVEKSLEPVRDANPEADARAFADGLDAEAPRGAGPRAAADAYARGLAVAASGEIRMLLAHRLARARVALGDAPGAAAACDEVLHPRAYWPYRALLVPDCLLWTGAGAATPAEAAAAWHRLSDAWTSAWTHPAVEEARARLAAR